MSSIDRRRKTVAKRGSREQFPAWVLRVIVMAPAIALILSVMAYAIGAKIPWQSFFCLTRLCRHAQSEVLKKID